MADGCGDSLLSVPLKTTTETDWVNPLKTLFKAAKLSQNFEAQMNEFNRLRVHVVAQGIEKAVPSLEAMQRYYDQVAALQSKVPSELMKIEFTWIDAFDKGSLFGGRKYLSLPFIGYEQICILFNIAALQTQLAAEGKVVNSDEELKTAAKWLQSASGIFAHLSSLVTMLPEDALTGDIHPNTLSALSALMLAQAQEIFLQKAIKGRMKDSIVAKIAIVAENLFSDALLKMTKQNVKYQFDRAWLTNVAGKQFAYDALAHFFQSKVCNMNKDIGEEIARLNTSIDLFKKAQEKSGNSSLFSYYITEANRLFTSAKTDNDFIYHAAVPTTENLPTVEKVATARLAKVTPLASPQFPAFKDMFENLSTISVSSSGKPVVTQNADSYPPPTDRSSAEQFIPSPLKQVFDASMSAMSSYLLRYLEKQQQQPKKE